MIPCNSKELQQRNAGTVKSPNIVRCFLQTSISLFLHIIDDLIKTPVGICLELVIKYTMMRKALASKVTHHSLTCNLVILCGRTLPETGGSKHLSSIAQSVAYQIYVKWAENNSINTKVSFVGSRCVFELLRQLY